MKQAEYIDRAKEALTITSDYKFSIEVSINRGDLKRFRDESRKFDEYTVTVLSEILDIEPMSIIADVQSQLEKNDDKREFWVEKRKKYSQGLKGWTGFAMLSSWGVAGEILSRVSKPCKVRVISNYVKNCKNLLVAAQ